MSTTEKMKKHFERVAHVYSDVRNTDSKIIKAIVSHFPPDNVPIDIIDIGCGTGRYSELIAKHLNSKNSRFFCCDYSGAMLLKCRERMDQKFSSPNIHYCRIDANLMPFPDSCFDALVTFNSIHHFDLDGFVANAARVLRPGGLLSIYTRTPEQNKRTIWGQHFPQFTERETRLYQTERLKQAIEEISELQLKSINTFKHERVESPESLLNRARNFHYSTFALYPEDEFNQAIDVFSQRLNNISINGKVKHTAENTLLLVHKA